MTEFLAKGSSPGAFYDFHEFGIITSKKRENLPDVNKIYRLSMLMPLKSCATSLISRTPNAVWTEFSSSAFAASHI